MLFSMAPKGRDGARMVALFQVNNTSLLKFLFILFETNDSDIL